MQGPDTTTNSCDAVRERAAGRVRVLVVRECVGVRVLVGEIVGKPVVGGELVTTGKPQNSNRQIKRTKLQVADLPSVS